MAPRARKRIHALQRAPGGSAFHKCEDCGISVAIALFDMHECGIKSGFVKRRKAESEQVLNIDEQPRSPFCCFMESFKKTCKTENLIKMSQRGFDAWQTMSDKERDPFVVQAETVNFAYSRILLEESYNMSEVDDEADSATVGKFDPVYKHKLDSYGKFNSSESGYKNPLNYNGSLHWGIFESFDSFDSSDWDELDTWFDD